MLQYREKWVDEILLTDALTFGGSGIEVGTASLTVCAAGLGVKGGVG